MYPPVEVSWHPIQTTCRTVEDKFPGGGRTLASERASGESFGNNTAATAWDATRS